MPTHEAPLDAILMPGERLLFRAQPKRMRRSGVWLWWPLFSLALGVVSALFSGLLRIAALPGAADSLSIALTFGIFSVGSLWLYEHLHTDMELAITDQRLIWRRGAHHRSMQRDKLSFARVRWRGDDPLVGQIELVAAVPFGPLKRKQRIVWSDVEGPDRVLSILRGGEASPHAGDRDVALTDRLDQGEVVLWGGGPAGLNIGAREHLTALLGLAIMGIGIVVGYQNFSVLLHLEELGLPVRSLSWSFLFVAVLVSWIAITSVGASMVYLGWWRSAQLASETEYLLTNRRLLLRRGPQELSVERQKIVDIVARPRGGFTLRAKAPGGLMHLHLVLSDSAEVSDSGALKMIEPGRASLPPILFEVEDGEAVRDRILRRAS